MSGFKRTVARLLGVQSGWTYERMGGIGVAFAARSLLEERVPAERRDEAIARSAEFFNSHPWLAGLAVGAEVRAEQDAVAPEQIRRLRTALGGPLGALGDRVIWAGIFPLLSGVAIIGALVLGWIVPVAAVGLAFVVRLEMTRWALACGLESGMSVAAVLKRSVLSRFGVSLGLAAAVAVGLAVPVFARATMQLPALHLVAPALILGSALCLVVVLRAGARLPSYRLALVAGALLLILWQVQRR
ncbi:MAG: PTS system mannose/fructose/sorbose family transporter subunit IID [Gemmatimonadetes bacterium]|nr:PTS system mannose/fructose/sorbose family transporter subunit IID [Gemmatimonadota bacterium]